MHPVKTIPAVTLMANDGQPSGLGGQLALRIDALTKYLDPGAPARAFQLGRNIANFIPKSISIVARITVIKILSTRHVSVTPT